MFQCPVSDDQQRKLTIRILSDDSALPENFSVLAQPDLFHE